MLTVLTLTTMPVVAHAEMAEELLLEGLPSETNVSYPGVARSTNEGEFTSVSVRTIDSDKVKAVLSANPGQELVICLAGCKGGHASILWQRPLAARMAYAAALNASGLAFGKSPDEQAAAENGEPPKPSADPN